jgi:hypothetical protein
LIDAAYFVVAVPNAALQDINVSHPVRFLEIDDQMFAKIIKDFFMDISYAIAGWASGGPAKIAVISSALEGTVSGSSVANTVGSGSFTIPMMIRLGYRPEFAGAVEAAASTGGQIMPPVMGAAAFLMAEFMNVPYAEVVKAAIIPAILYFTGVFVEVHFEAKKCGLRGLSREELPDSFLHHDYIPDFGHGRPHDRELRHHVNRCRPGPNQVFSKLSKL